MRHRAPTSLILVGALAWRRKAQEVHVDQLVPEALDDLVSTAEAADMCGVGRSTISMWKKRGWLEPAGLDDHDRPLYKRIDVLRAARDTRNRALGKARTA